MESVGKFKIILNFCVSKTNFISDIPLLGLREASREVEGDYHELFTDESYKISQCFMLSTSQVTTVAKCVALFRTILYSIAQFVPFQTLHNKNVNVCTVNSQFYFYCTKKFVKF